MQIAFECGEIQHQIRTEPYILICGMPFCVIMYRLLFLSTGVNSEGEGAFPS